MDYKSAEEGFRQAMAALEQQEDDPLLDEYEPVIDLRYEMRARLHAECAPMAEQFDRDIFDILTNKDQHNETT